MHAVAGPRARVGAFIESDRIQRWIIALILINAAVLGLETSPTVMEHTVGPWLLVADKVILGIFVVEILLKLFAQGWGFFRRPWNVFDFLVVGIALVPASGPMAVLRVLRLLRLVSMMPKLRFIVEALLKAIPGILSILGLLVLLFYVFAVIATGLFGKSFPEWFGSLGQSMYTLFQVMTLESWSMGIARPVMEQYNWAWVFFVPFILIATFTILNLFIAIIVNTMQSMQEDQQQFEHDTIEEVVHAENTQLHEDLKALRQEIRELRKEISNDPPSGSG
ncbi:ion transporter [Ectothiorhodospira variabilis]|uniref:ion transporter n=1 Tax=Ectothiorhodospira variabilis TaxID=505694 RepID=UPI001EFB0E6A|nr:ion transporter [Ectothiorhodospira variabilis]MCG5494865.1 ion transporter [Ectothiorhodospira variabilis]MCG5497730.1 ion transporter [Ectothiorhodospira variabilis]MCG5504378.1 ion transporter [Ectothiorhodospira variabilis]MCG5507533.1 ion transporter [Ectothiorhodospira variabilis]